jgi:hypothetical protein
MEDLLETTKSSGNQEVTADNLVLIQFATKTTKLLAVGQVEEREVLTCKVKVMRRHGETC